jgi:hypothetical protein
LSRQRGRIGDEKITMLHLLPGKLKHTRFPRPNFLELDLPGITLIQVAR